MSVQGGISPVVAERLAQTMLGRPEVAERALVRHNLANKTILSAFQKFKKEHIDDLDENHQLLSMREFASVVLNQFADVLERVSADKWHQMQIEEWQANLLPKAPAQFRDIDGMRYTTVWWGDPKLLYAPVGTAPRNIEMEMREMMLSSARYSRGIQIVADALFTEDGLSWAKDGVSHLLHGAVVTQALLLTFEMIGQKWYEQHRLDTCMTVPQYENLIKRLDILRFIINKADYPMRALQLESYQEMSREMETGPDAAIVSESVAIYCENKLKEDLVFWRTGKPLNFADRDKTKGVIKLSNSVSSPSIIYHVLPGNFAKDDPLEQDVTSGSSWNLGWNPAKGYYKNLHDPGKFDIEAYAIATDKMEHIYYRDALKYCKLFAPDGHIADIESAGPNYKPEDALHDPFMRKTGPNSKQLEPIDYIGEYKIKRTELIVRHADSLLDYCARKAGIPVSDINKAFSEWLAWMEQMDNVSFAQLEAMEPYGSTRTDDVYRQPFVDYDMKAGIKIPVFASTYNWLIKIASNTPSRFDETLVNVARRFLLVFRTLVACIDDVHDCMLTKPGLTPPECFEQINREAAFYSYCMSTLGHEHLQLWEVTKGKFTAAEVERVLAPLGQPDKEIKFKPEIYKSIAESTRNMDLARAFVVGLMHVKRGNKLSAEDAKEFTNFTTLDQIENKVRAVLTAANAKSTLEKYEQLILAAKSVQPEEAAADYSSYQAKNMTSLSIPRERRAQFMEWNQKNFQENKVPPKFTIQETGDEAIVPGVWAATLQVKSAPLKLPVKQKDTTTALEVQKMDDYHAHLREIEKLYGSKKMKKHMKEIFALCTSEPLLWITWAVLHSKFTKACIENSVRNYVLPLINLLVTQQNTQIRGTSIVLLKGGADTGMINTTQFDMRFSIGAATKWFLGHLSVKIGIWIKEPRNVWPFLGCFAHSVAFGGRIGDNMYAESKEDITSYQKDLCVFPMSIEEWPLAWHFSVINRYPEMDSHNDNECTLRLSTGYRNNQNWKFYQSGQSDYVKPVVSPGMALYMDEKGRYTEYQKDMGIFAGCAKPGLHRRLMGIHTVQESDHK